MLAVWFWYRILVRIRSAYFWDPVVASGSVALTNQVQAKIPLPITGMASIIGLDVEKTQALVDAANAEVDASEKVRIKILGGCARSYSTFIRSWNLEERICVRTQTSKHVSHAICGASPSLVVLLPSRYPLPSLTLLLYLIIY